MRIPVGPQGLIELVNDLTIDDGYYEAKHPRLRLWRDDTQWYVELTKSQVRQLRPMADQRALQFRYGAK